MTLRELYAALCLLCGVDDIKGEHAVMLAEAEMAVKGSMGVMWHVTGCPKYVADPPRRKLLY